MILDAAWLGWRDRRILALTAEKLGGAAPFADVLAALRAAVELQIAGGRVFLLGGTADGPIFGSLRSGVGLVDAAAGVRLVRAR